MKTLRSAGALLLCLSLAGCSTLQDVLGGLRKPSASIEGVRFTGLALNHISVAFDAEVRNPYEFALPLVELDVSLSHEQARFLEAKAPVQGDVPARGVRTVTIPARIDFRGLMEVVRSLKPGGQIPYSAELGVAVDVPGGSRLRLPLRHEGSVGVPVPPRVSVASISLDRISLTEIRARATMRAESANTFPVELEALDYTFDVRGRTLARSSITSPFALEPSGQVTWTLPLVVNPLEAGQIFLNLFRGESMDVQIQGDLRVQTPFGALNAPVSSNSRAAIN